jgi:hypothetical protein
MPNEAQVIKDLQDFTVRLQKQVNELQKRLDDTSLVPSSIATELVPFDSFEDRVWESVLSTTIANMLHPGQILPTDTNTQMKMMMKALKTADMWVAAAKKYKQEKEEQRKEEKKADPIKELLNK